MEKVMKHVNLTFWEKLFNPIRRLNFAKNTKNILDYHIMDANLHGRNKPETIKQIIMPSSYSEHIKSNMARKIMGNKKTYKYITIT